MEDTSQHPRSLLRKLLPWGSQRQAATSLGCSEQHLSNILAGRTLPSLTLAAAIEREYGIPAASWVEAA